MNIKEKLQNLKNNPEDVYSHAQSEETFSRNYTNPVEVKYIPTKEVYELRVFDMEGGEQLESKTFHSVDEVLADLNLENQK
ncbi:hypothetical protein QUF84_10590 [Fictibacillus enclensis]|uniref:hypothetical protein n=1 Tax=Fictibacillus enclensis TaxID=1017270 RepID=UPI0024BFB10F|nr:hypothetical protein [Fictibacillus enclensis]MDM5337665.1 hypothetical protein [Fictibacillus enclensis]WHY74033.1 hypothetical protein QNH15_09065 [Fictibacillus enclensis]